MRPAFHPVHTGFVRLNYYPREDPLEAEVATGVTDLAKTIIPFVSGAVATEPLPDTLRGSILHGRQAASDSCRLLSWFGLDPEGVRGTVQDKPL